MMSASIMTDRHKAIVSQFSDIEDWEDRYKKIIEIGKGLVAIDDGLKTDEKLVKGCQSQVWMHAKLDPESRRVKILADSDALIVRGLVALLLQLYSDAAPDDIIHTNPDFIADLGFSSHLSPSRANGLNAMVKQIKLYAFAFKMMAQQSEQPQKH